MSVSCLQLTVNLGQVLYPRTNFTLVQKNRTPPRDLVVIATMNIILLLVVALLSVFAYGDNNDVRLSSLQIAHRPSRTFADSTAVGERRLHQTRS
jgi:hypothetical protein